MSLQDIFTRSGRYRARRLRPARRGRGLLRRWPAGSARATARGLRRLAAIDRGLAVETPRLASMFAMFNELAGGEPVGAERLPPSAWPRPRLAQVAFLATLAVIVALGVALCTQLHGVTRPCAAAAPASSAASPPALSAVPPSASSAASPPALSAVPPSASSAASASALSAVPPSASPAVGPADPPSSGPAAFSPLRYLSCQAYAAPNK